MDQKDKLSIFNTLSKQKEQLIPLHPGSIGMYVCGPTVYGEPHLGHARPGITFDLIFRYLQHIGYKVRYVRNITDVGHLENDADSGEDKIIKKARLEELEPMEVAQYYIDSYHFAMDELNVKRPSIEPRASGHVIEQIEMIEKIMEKGYAYLSNGSVYFDVSKYDQNYGYGKLSGRVLEEMIANTRTLDGQDEKRNPADFALWKKASPEHIMRWKSPWSVGFPGWHIECTAMSTKYLGEHFDIHGGGMDLLFPHHESEVCQSTVANGVESVKYWIHNNMITINGKKMGKSLGNFITLNQFFTGDHPLLEKAFTPMTIRFFILQAQYRSTLDFSNEALLAAEKGMLKLYAALDVLSKLKATDNSTIDVEAWISRCYDAMNDDFNSSKLIAELFEATHFINTIHAQKASLNLNDLELLKKYFHLFFFDILGMKPQSGSSESGDSGVTNQLMDLILSIRQEAKDAKNWAVADTIRKQLGEMGITIKDTKEGATWER